MFVGYSWSQISLEKANLKFQKKCVNSKDFQPITSNKLTIVF